MADRKALDAQLRGLLRLIAETQREIELVEVLGSEESYEIGTVVRFEKEYDGTPGRMYSYAAIKYAGRWPDTAFWAVTGMSGNRALPWPALVAFITDKASTVRISVAPPSRFDPIWPIERDASATQATEEFAAEAIEAIRATGVTAAEFADAVRANVIRLTGDGFAASVAHDATIEAGGSIFGAAGMTGDEPTLPPDFDFRRMTLAERERLGRELRASRERVAREDAEESASDD